VMELNKAWVLPGLAGWLRDCACAGIEAVSASSSVELGDKGLVLLFAERGVVTDSDETGGEAMISSMRICIENTTNGDLRASGGKNEVRTIGPEGGNGDGGGGSDGGRRSD
jgi:hypothetical protein